MIPKEINTMLVASDFSEVAERAAQLAFSIVAKGGKVILFHAVKPFELASPMHAHNASAAVLVEAWHESPPARCRAGVDS